MNKLSQAYKIGSRLALTKHLPNLSRSQLLALGGAGGGLGALALGLSAAESKALAKGLVDDAVSALPKVSPGGTTVAKELAGKVAPEIVGPPSQVARDHALKKIEAAFKEMDFQKNLSKGVPNYEVNYLTPTASRGASERAGIPNFHKLLRSEFKAQYADKPYLSSKFGPLGKRFHNHKVWLETMRDQAELGRKLERMNMEDLTSLRDKLIRAAPEDIGKILQPYRQALASKDYVRHLDLSKPTFDRFMKDQLQSNQLNAFNRQRLAAEKLNPANEVELMLARVAGKL